MRKREGKGWGRGKEKVEKEGRKGVRKREGKG